MPITPYILTGHTRDVSHVAFNHEGDIFFSCSKDKTCQAWYTQEGKRLGSYDLQAAVTCCEPTLNSKFLLTSSSDGNASVFDIETGALLKQFPHKQPLRDCAWAIGESMFAVVQTHSKSCPSQISVWTFDHTDLEGVEVRTLVLHGSDITGTFQKARFVDTSGTLIAIHNDGTVSKWNTDDEACIEYKKISEKPLTDISLTPDRGLALITSRDHRAYLVNVETLEIVKTYESDRPLNAAAMSPTMNHVLVAGGQDKHEVTLSGTTEGHFEVEFWHSIYEERLESVTGHYGPVNSLSVSRDGKAFISGSEDGNIRLYHFDDVYFKSSS